MDYREEQKNIMEYKSGYMAIPSVPGAGKTFIATHLTAKIIKNEWHKPGKVLILTYMNSAVNNFKARLSKLLEEEGIISNKDYEVMTIHSLAMKIVKEKPDLVNVSEEFEIIDPVTQISLIDRCIDEWKEKNRRALKYFLNENKINQDNISNAYKSVQKILCKTMSAIIGEIKNRELTPQDLNDMTKNLDNKRLIKLASDIYSMYDRYLKLNGLLDYDDLLVLAYLSLKNDEDLRTKFQKKYTYILEDEAQDSNIIQQKILFLLSKNTGNLIKVGDSNQSIMSTFTNSDPKLFRDFYNNTADKVERMLTAGRSTREIIDLANYFVDWVRNHHPLPECKFSLEDQKIETVKPGEKPENPKSDNYNIRAYKFKSQKDEISTFLTLAQKFIVKNPDKTIAALVPSGDMLSIIADELDSRGIDYDELSDSSKDIVHTTKILGKVIEYLAEPYNNYKFVELFEKVLMPGEYDNKESLFNFLKEYNLEKILYPRGGIIDIKEIPNEIRNTTTWDEFLQKCAILKKLLDFPHTAVDRLILYMADILNFDTEEKAVAQKVAADVKHLFITNPKWTFNDLANELLDSKNSKFNYFAKIVYEMKGYEPAEGKITISTYHKSKGLEWDCVFLLGLTHNYFPVTLSDKFLGENYYLKDDYSNPGAIVKAELEQLLNDEITESPILRSRKENISEKARLLYVAITRAKEYLFLMSHEDNIGKWNEEKYSQYFIELANYISRRRKEFDGDK